MKPLKLTDKQLDELAQVENADIMQARVKWQTYAPTWAWDMFDAVRKVASVTKTG